MHEVREVNAMIAMILVTFLLAFAPAAMAQDAAPVAPAAEALTPEEEELRYVQLEKDIQILEQEIKQLNQDYKKGCLEPWQSEGQDLTYRQMGVKTDPKIADQVQQEWLEERTQIDTTYNKCNSVYLETYQPLIDKQNEFNAELHALWQKKVEAQKDSWMSKAAKECAATGDELPCGNPEYWIALQRQQEAEAKAAAQEALPNNRRKSYGANNGPGAIQTKKSSRR